MVLGMPENSRSMVRLISIGVACLVLGVFLPALKFDFTNYDDPDYVTENRPVLAGLTWKSLGWAFTHSHSANWHPLTWISHMADCQLYGVNPAGHHLTSILLHAANAVLLFLFLCALTRRDWPSAAVAVLFALHPLRVESVAWISERKDVLSGFFGLLCLWAYAVYTHHAWGPGVETGNALNLVKKDHRRVKVFYCLSIVAFALGLMSKPMLVTWPFVLLLLDFWPLGRFGNPVAPRGGLKKALLEKIPFFALSAASCLVTLLVQQSAGALASASFSAKAINALVCYFRYISKTVWPVRLAVLYPEVASWAAVEILLATTVLSAITAVVLWQIRKRPWLATGWAWFLGTLVPVIGLVKVGSQSMADRYTYLTSIGLLIMLVWTVAELAAKIPGLKTAVAAVLGGVVLALGFATAAQLRFWQNTDTLFRHAIAVTDNNYVAWSSLAFDYAEHKEFREAEDCLRRSLGINPNYYQAWNKLGSVLIDQGRFSEAEAACQSSVNLDPRFAPAHSTLGLALMKTGRTNEAIAEYQQALGLRPDFAPAHYNLANALASQQKFAEARDHYQASLDSDPDSPAAADAHNNLGYLLAREGRLEEAAAHFKSAIARLPLSWQAQFGLGDVLSRQGKSDEAAAAFSEVVRINPNQAAGHLQLANLLARLARGGEAVEHYEKSLQLSPNNIEALNRLAWLLATCPDSQLRNGSRAVQLAERAGNLAGAPRPGLLLTLAAAYAEADRFSDAIHAAERAREIIPAGSQPELSRKIELLLQELQSGKPYRESPAGK